MKSRTLILVGLLLFFSGCGKISGEFSVKGFHDDAYHRILKKPLEVKSGDSLKWIYRFDSAPGPIKIAVIVTKKMLVPVEQENRIEKLDPGVDLIYGIIEGYSPGSYEIHIVTVDDRKLIDTLPLIVYEE